MKFFNWIWSKPKKARSEVQQPWTIERDGWEQSVAAYNSLHHRPKGEL